MKLKFPSVFLLFAFTIFHSQKLSFKSILKDKISIRAIELWDNKVFYTGTDSKFGYVSLKDSANKKQIRLTKDNLQFRTLAQDKNSFYTINIESPGHFFVIDKATFQHKIFFSDYDSAFYDALHFSGKQFYAFSDAEKDLKFKFLTWKGGDGIYNVQDFRQSFPNLKLKDGENAFASSNSNIASSKKYVWIATGGTASRIFRLDLHKNKFEIFETPFVQGTSSQGMYSIDFYKDKFGIAVGGDYTKQSENFNNIATTSDAGKPGKFRHPGKMPATKPV